jgi:hypothetical protein
MILSLEKTKKYAKIPLSLREFLIILSKRPIRSLQGRVL